MTDVLVTLLLFAVGPVLLAEALLARYEVLAYQAGWHRPPIAGPDGMAYARGAGPDRPPTAYLVYLDGIGKRRFRDSRDSGRLVQAVVDRAPGVRVLGQVLPYSPMVSPLAERPGWRWLRRHAGVLLFVHNAMQVFIAADRRYRPMYNHAVGDQIAAQLRLAGYREDSGIPVVLAGYSGGAQLATGAVTPLHNRLRAPIHVILLGGFHSGTNDLSQVARVDRITGSGDRVERVGSWIFPRRWPVWRRSAWNRARRAGLVTDHRFAGWTHVGPRGYLSDAHLESTITEVLAIIGAITPPSGPVPTVPATVPERPRS
ncbi:hypothetical protein M1L60_14755 [Actinoplanes sp. TRM 88003]|uniref:Uncharacterized protein n=1 Tax=Paractinoplanes aksuensis TaxID=2939490 RepID=A0ABT1DQ40_9ACTN|nr:hypothetical protein [Actinoplanes aksuensis]MCO8271856.1 hypothetical protein [Actinoplanes aksuensis]